MKSKIVYIALLATLGITSCSKNNDVTSNVVDSSEKSNIKENTIVVYFSATSHTEKVAQEISEKLNVSIYNIEPVTPYTTADLNYNNQNSRVVLEHNDVNRHVELKETSFSGFEEAKYIFLGAPVWWQELSWVINDFLVNNNFEDKTIIPFGTSASSNFTIDNLKPLAKNASWSTPKRFSSNTSLNNVDNWLKELGFIE